MVIRMLEVCRGFQGSFSAKLGVDEFDPKQIAPTIAPAPPPPINRKANEGTFKDFSKNQKIVKRCRSDTQ